MSDDLNVKRLTERTDVSRKTSVFQSAGERERDRAGERAFAVQLTLTDEMHSKTALIDNVPHEK